MKIPIGISVFIVAAVAGYGWHVHQRLVGVRARHAEIVSKAAGRGIFLEPGNPLQPIRVTKRPRENREAEAKQVSGDMIAFRKARTEDSSPEDQRSVMERYLDLKDRLASLDADQMEIILSEIQAAGDIEDGTRKSLMNDLISALAEEHPEAALALFKKSPQVLKDAGMGEWFIRRTVEGWFKNDPTAAVEWFRKERAEFPSLAIDFNFKAALIRNAAIRTPRLAFQLMGELDIGKSQAVINGTIDDAKSVDERTIRIKQAMDDAKTTMNRTMLIGNIIDVAKTAEERTITLAALREHLAKIEDAELRSQVQASALENFAENVSQEDFKVGAKWLADARLTPTEIADFARGFNSRSKTVETGKWIEWLGINASPDVASGCIWNLFINWSKQDYKAAGNWLATASDGPAKTTAIGAYATAVFSHDPETAVQWLMVVPEEERNAVVKKLCEVPDDEPASAEAVEAFKKEHGIK